MDWATYFCLNPPVARECGGQTRQTYCISCPNTGLCSIFSGMALLLEPEVDLQSKTSVSPDHYTKQIFDRPSRLFIVVWCSYILQAITPI